MQKKDYLFEIILLNLEVSEVLDLKKRLKIKSFFNICLKHGNDKFLSQISKTKAKKFTMPNPLRSFIYLSAITNELDYLGECLILMGYDIGEVILYNFVNEEFNDLKKYKEHTTYLWGLVYFGNYKKRHFLSGGYDNKIKMWDIEQSSSVLTFDNGGYIISLGRTLNYKNSVFITGDYKRDLKIWDVETKKDTLLGTYSNYVNCILHLENFPPYNLLVASSLREIKLWDLTNYSEKITFKFGATQLFHWKDDKIISSQNSIIKIWKFSTAEIIKKIKLNTPFQYINLFRKSEIMVIIREKSCDCVNISSLSKIYSFEFGFESTQCSIMGISSDIYQKTLIFACGTISEVIVIYK
jgi:WD40 repeat protein